ncbi:MAG: L,D-transpeptidase [Verrucomicrobiota bacterium]
MASRPFLLERVPARFLWKCRFLHVRPTRFALVANVQRQAVSLFVRTPPASTSHLRPGAGWSHPVSYSCCRWYLASTSRFGVGQQSGSNRTPLGLHRVAEKVGAGQIPGTVFETRRPVGLTWQGHPDAPIAHRILWLEGLEPGFNQGGEVDSRARFIYIHGLANEPSLGRPSSRGCIHLAAADLVPLFDRIPVGTLVWIE